MNFPIRTELYDIMDAIDKQQYIYYDFLTKAGNEDANQALKRIAPRIHMEQIEDFIDHVPGITNLQKLFYK